MNRRQPTWPIVGLFTVAAGTFLGAVALTPADKPELRSALIGVLVAAGSAGIARYLGPRVEQIHTKVEDMDAKLSSVGEKVNGRMSQLLDRLAAAERRAAVAEQQLHVSRETSGPGE